MLVLTIYILTFAVGFPANVFTFTTLVAKARRHRPSPSDLLLLNLTAADLLLLLFLPFKMAEAAAGMVWPLPAALCPVANFCFYSSIYLSSLFLTALSVRRYLGVAFPLRLRGRGRLGRVAAASAVLWLLACSHCSIVFIASYHGGGLGAGQRGGLRPHEPKTPNTTLNPRDSKIYPNLSKTLNPHYSTTYPNHSMPPNLSPSTSPAPSIPFRCYDDFSEDQLSFVLPLRLELFLVMFLVPFGVTVFCYVGFVRALLARPNIPRAKRRRAVGLAVATMVNFGLCFAPYNVSHVVGFVQGRSPPWRVYATLLSSLNAAIDPLVFYFSSGAVRGALAGVGAALLGKMEGVKLTVNKGLSNHFQVNHTVALSTLGESNYHFGATYVGTKQLSPTEAFPVLVGDMDNSGSLNAQVIHQVTGRLRSKVAFQTQQAKFVNWQVDGEYRGSDFTAALTLGNPDILLGSGILVAHYLQSVTPTLALGGELVYHRRPGEEGAVVSLAGRYTAPTWIGTLTLGQAGAHATYYHRASEQGPRHHPHLHLRPRHRPRGLVLILGLTFGRGTPVLLVHFIAAVLPIVTLIILSPAALHLPPPLHLPPRPLLLLLSPPAAGSPHSPPSKATFGGHSPPSGLTPLPSGN
ncbi:PREDICTED: uncharacterized protein LOC108510163 [Lepidothrix coronata]|uniref:Uncharacterized protein LOC108510163 n=1 Tax=Lepidothrix coronata TaxID=321398 RepID=A0A6J0J8V5_9PASS|nr:PREDICTED: uncharacterized protein LOC108510163 [Lepidothrix coronata]